MAKNSFIAEVTFNVCFEETGKVVDVILRTSLCTQCSQKNKEKEKRLLNVVEYMVWYVEHKLLCWKNHKGSSAVSILNTFLGTFIITMTYHQLLLALYESVDHSHKCNDPYSNVR